jgi:hypothetical protein
MNQQTELFKTIDSLPEKYFIEVIDFVAYLQHKAQKETVQQKIVVAREIECINCNAEELNKEMADVLLDQSLDL